ncbi:hypothetical protein EVAR_3693_1 [Eumeta japonica]|uniref:Uncharacterized protein n=1 Tax=Eumeta variegata TaxID=151549 RepID=A0A4C1SRG7_EUMVA|nr:hypothetical protein EVAR_3693_1 [Eumeta japonica]
MSHRTRERPAECLASLSHSTMIGLPRALERLDVHYSTEASPLDVHDVRSEATSRTTMVHDPHQVIRPSGERPSRSSAKFVIATPEPFFSSRYQFYQRCALLIVTRTY